MKAFFYTEFLWRIFLPSHNSMPHFKFFLWILLIFGELYVWILSNFAIFFLWILLIFGKLFVWKIKKTYLCTQKIKQLCTIAEL